MPDTQQSSQPMTEEQELIARAEFLGRKLGLFIAALEIAEEEREAVLDALDQFTLIELEALVDFFEIVFIHTQTGEIDEEFRKRAQALAEKYQKQEEDVLKKTLAKIEALEREKEQFEAIYAKINAS